MCAGESVSLRPDEVLPLEQLTDDKNTRLPSSSDVGSWPWRRRLVKRILLFAAPAISMPLADPLMSLVDTICIGQVLVALLPCPALLASTQSAVAQAACVTQQYPHCSCNTAPMAETQILAGVRDHGPCCLGPNLLGVRLCQQHLHWAQRSHSQVITGPCHAAWAAIRILHISMTACYEPSTSCMHPHATYLHALACRLSTTWPLMQCHLTGVGQPCR